MLTRADIEEFEQIGDNIDNRDVERAINKAELLDLPAALSASLIATLPDASAAGIALYAYVRPWLAYCAYKRFLSRHGIHVGQAGLMTVGEASVQPISSQQRNILMDEIEGAITIYRARLDEYLNGTYTDTCGTRTRGGGNAVAI